MPFKNKRQMRACFAKNDPNWDCKKWAAITPKDIPESFLGWLEKRMKDEVTNINTNGDTSMKKFIDFIKDIDPKFYTEMTGKEVEKKEKKPSAGVSKKKKSKAVKDAKKGKDMFGKGKNFKKIEKKAEKKYGKKSAEKIAGSVFWKKVKGK